MKIKIDNTLEQNVNCLVNGENDGDFKLRGNTKSVIINDHEVLKHWNQDTALAGGPNDGGGSNIFLRPYGSGATTNQAQLYPSGKLSIKELAVDGAATIGGTATVDSITVNSGFGKKYVFKKTMTLTTSWQTVLNHGDLPSGAYIVHVQGIQSADGKGWQENNRYVGIMSWYDGQTNASEESPITLHTTGHAHNGEVVYLSTFNHFHSTELDVTLEIKYSIDWANPHTITFTFVKIV